MNKEEYKCILEYNELIHLVKDLYLLPGYDLVFDYNKSAIVYGVIPLDLANEIYEIAKSNEISLYNSPGSRLDTPAKVACHKELTNLELHLNKVGIKTMIDILEEKRKELVEEDYDNCYIKRMTLNDIKTLEWFINYVKGYYKKKNNIKSLK